MTENSILAAKRPSPIELGELSPTAFFWKGRVALYAILKSLGIGPGDTVVVPGYTCVVVPAAVYFAGAKPVYADIDPATFNATLAEIQRACQQQPIRAIVIQHTYGLPADIGPIRRWAAERDIYLIEDCCHALGSRYREITAEQSETQSTSSESGETWQRVGQLADASFFSSQWSKPIPTGLGGWAVTQDADLAEKLRQFQQTECVSPQWSEAKLLKLQVWMYRRFFRPALYWKAQAMLRWLSKRGFMVGSSTTGELQMQQSADYAKQMTTWQQKLIMRGLQNISAQQSQRKDLQSLYDELLTKAGLPVLKIPTYADPVLLRYPVRVAEKQNVLAAAKAARIELGDWFDHPLHPAGLDLEPLGWETGLCPHGEQAAAEVVNLPMHDRVTPEDAKRAVELLKRYQLSD